MSIQIDRLTKRFGSFTALNEVSLTIPTGQLAAVLGPSGSGKTTLLRIIAGLEMPDEGQLFLHGVDATPLSARDRQVGFVFQHYALFRHMTVFENVAFGLRVQPRRSRPSEEEIRGRVKELLRLVELEDYASRMPSQLSGGQRQRVALARALAVRPKVLLLDEPASGLDPRARIEIKELLKELKSMGKTILISSHILPELADFCNKIGIIEKGKLVISGGVQEIMRQVRGGRVLLVRVLDEPDRAIELLETMEGILSASVDEVHSAIRIEFAGDETAQHALLRRLIENGVRVQSFDEVQTDLEEIFMKVTRGIVS